MDIQSVRLPDVYTILSLLYLFQCHILYHITVLFPGGLFHVKGAVQDYSVHAPEQEGQAPKTLFMEGSFNETPRSLESLPS